MTPIKIFFQYKRLAFRETDNNFNAVVALPYSIPNNQHKL
jgi:hypothetical protein